MPTAAPQTAADARSAPQHLQHLRALLDGPYAGRGGRAALARAVGVAPRTLARWATGDTWPLFDHRRALAGLLSAALADAARARTHTHDDDRTG